MITDTIYHPISHVVVVQPPSWCGYILSDAIEESLSATTIPFVKKIHFDVGRHGAIEKEMTFEWPVTLREAIQQAEQWLKQPMEKAHFAQLMEQGDLFGGGEGDTMDLYPCRGHALGDCRFLYEIVYQSEDTIRLVCGS